MERIRRLDLAGWFIGGSFSCLQLHERAQKRPTIQRDELPDLLAEDNPVAVDGCLAASVLVDLGTTIRGAVPAITGKISTGPNPDISLTLQRKF